MLPVANPITNQLLRIHSIETFGTHDGPGIRFVVFVQGCQFRCLYCANPDTLPLKGGSFITLDEIERKVMNQKNYFGKSGGITISGGEPILQRKVLIPLFQRLQKLGIHTALDSNGKVLDRDAKELLSQTDLLLLDIKHIDSNWHQKLTSLPNDKVLEMAAYRESTGKPMWLRYVLVPGWTDQPEYLHKLGRHFANYKTIKKIEILPFHQLGKHKWEALGKPYQLTSIPPASSKTIRIAEEILGNYFKDVSVN